MDRAVELVGRRGIVEGAADRGFDFFRGLGDPSRFQPFGKLGGALAEVFGEEVKHLGAVVAGGLAPALRRMGGLDRVPDVLAVAETGKADDAALVGDGVGIARVGPFLRAADVEFRGAVDARNIRSDLARRVRVGGGVGGDGRGFGFRLDRGFGQIGQQAFAPALAAEARLAVAAETGGGVEDVGAVHPDHARLDLRGHIKREVDVFRPDRGGEAVAGVVGQFHRLVRGAEGGERGDGTEDLDF